MFRVDISFNRYSGRDVHVIALYFMLHHTLFGGRVSTEGCLELSVPLVFGCCSGTFVLLSTHNYTSCDNISSHHILRHDVLYGWHHLLIYHLSLHLVHLVSQSILICAVVDNRYVCLI